VNRIAAHVFVALVLASVAAATMSVSAFAKENPGNHYGKCCNPGNHYGQLSNPGHHYGQLKHKTPPPSPNPNPNPNPNPTPQPVTNPGGGSGSTSSTYNNTSGLTDGGATSTIPVTVTLPPQDKTSARVAPDSLPQDALDWLLLLLLPALLAVWVIAAAGLTRNAATRLRIARAAVPAPNPA
jgi:hypothetical protein